MSRPTLRPAARPVAGALLAAAAFVGAAAPSASATSFYDPPATLPSENGELVRFQSMKLGISVGLPFGVSSLPGTATRIMYKSTDTNGEAVAVTGVYIEPSKRFASGPRPLVTYAEGTIGQGDECAPSYGLESPIGYRSGSPTISYETGGIYDMLNRGFAVVVTDYVGLGTTDRLHTYVNRVDQGHAVLDAARAALKVKGASVTAESPVGAYGYSQGGGAAASAAELQPTYAPDVNLKAAMAGAPPADLDATMRKADGTTLTAVIGFAVNGLVQTYPQLQPILEAQTNTAGKAALKTVSGACIGDALAKFAYKKTSSWTKSGKSIAQVVASLPEVKAIVDEQKIGKRKPNVPVRILTGTLDDIVPHQQAKQLAADWCAQGVSVDYKPTKQWVDSFGSSLNHLGPMITDGGAAQNWFAERMYGKPATSNCSSLNKLP